MKQRLRFLLLAICSIITFSTPLFSQEQVDPREAFAKREAAKWTEQIFYVIDTALENETLKKELLEQKTQFVADGAEDLRNRLATDTLQQLSDWCIIPENRALIARMSMANDTQAVATFLQNNGLSHISADKMAKIKRIRAINNRGYLDAAFTSYLLSVVISVPMQVALDSRLASEASEVPPHSFFPVSAEDNENFRTALERFQQNAINGLAYAFAEVSDSDIEKLLAFLEEKAGRNWMQSSFRGNFAAIRSGTELMYRLLWKEEFLKKAAKKQN